MSKKKIFNIEDFHNSADELALQMLIMRRQKGLTIEQHISAIKLLLEETEPDPPPDNKAKEFAIELMFFINESEFTIETLREAQDKLGYGAEYDSIRNTS